MPEKCENNSCTAIELLRNDLQAMRDRNGEDHREFRDKMHELDIKEANLEGQFIHIAGSLSRIENDNKNVIEKLSPIVSKMEKVDDLYSDVKKLDGEVDELKAKPGKRWDGIAEKVIGLIVAAIVGLVLGRIGLT